MSHTELVGILNITPDSFSDGGQHQTPGDAIDYAARLFGDGASIVDVGAESTRPQLFLQAKARTSDLPARPTIQLTQAAP